MIEFGIPIIKPQEQTINKHLSEQNLHFMGQIVSFYLDNIKSEEKQQNELCLKTDTLQEKISLLESQYAELKTQFEYQLNQCQLMQKMNVDRQMVYEKSNNEQLKYIKKSLSEIADTFEHFFQEYDLQLGLQNKKIHQITFDILQKLGYDESESTINLMKYTVSSPNNKRELEQESVEEQFTSNSPKIKKSKTNQPIIDCIDEPVFSEEIAYDEEEEHEFLDDCESQ